MAVQKALNARAVCCVTCYRDQGQFGTVQDRRHVKARSRALVLAVQPSAVMSCPVLTKAVQGRTRQVDQSSRWQDR
jgi:hypothetical protein